MSATFYVCEPGLREEIDRLVDEMETEDIVEDVEDSAYDRFGALLEARHLAAIALTEEQSEPAEAFYQWFMDRVTQDFDKLYLTAPECVKALATIEKLRTKSGIDKLVAGFWSPTHDYSRETAQAYLSHVEDALRQAAAHKGLMVICYR